MHMLVFIKYYVQVYRTRPPSLPLKIPSQIFLDIFQGTEELERA